MPETIEQYMSQAVLPAMRKQARTVWTVSLAIVFVWIFLILLAPLAEIYNFNAVSRSVYKFFSYVCHQIPARSFHIADHQFAVCSRCFGVYFGLFFGFIVYPLFVKIEEVEALPRFWLFLAMVPIGIDWALGVFGFWENTHASRFLTGALLGAACAFYIIPALIELFRLLTLNKQLKRLSR